MFRPYMSAIFRLRSKFSAAAIQDVWGVGVGYWGFGKGRRARSRLFSIVSTMGIGGITSGLLLVFFVHVSKWVSILMLKVCYY